jgi:hypothetical protein
LFSHNIRLYRLPWPTSMNPFAKSSILQVTGNVCGTAMIGPSGHLCNFVMSKLPDDTTNCDNSNNTFTWSRPSGVLDCTLRRPEGQAEVVQW